MWCVIISSNCSSSTVKYHHVLHLTYPSTNDSGCEAYSCQQSPLQQACLTLAALLTEPLAAHSLSFPSFEKVVILTPWRIIASNNLKCFRRSSQMDSEILGDNGFLLSLLPVRPRASTETALWLSGPVSLSWRMAPGCCWEPPSGGTSPFADTVCACLAIVLGPVNLLAFWKKELPFS